MKHIIQFSGGLGSYGTARVVVDTYGAENTVLLFADTLIEDEDLYRFVDDAVKDLGCCFIRVADGRDPWQVFFDERFLGNSQVDPCSKILKRELLRKYLDDNFNVADDIIYIGIDWTESHRFEKARDRWLPWQVRAPLCEELFAGEKHCLKGKDYWMEHLTAKGIAIPRLYKHGFAHNNCSGFCIKSGQAQFKLLHDVFPERYAYHERRGQELRDYLGKDVSILKDRRGGKTKPMTLKAFRARIEAGDFDKHEWGGCGCVA